MGSYYPFELKHKGYNNVIVGRNHNYSYNGNLSSTLYYQKRENIHQYFFSIGAY